MLLYLANSELILPSSFLYNHCSNFFILQTILSSSLILKVRLVAIKKQDM